MADALILLMKFLAIVAVAGYLVYVNDEVTRIWEGSDDE